MANASFTCVLDAWREGTTLYGRMHYYRSGSYYYQDITFPNPTMNLGGTTYTDTAFGDRVRAGVSVGSVYSTTFSRTVSGTGTRTVTWTAGSGSRSDFAGTWSKDVGGFPGTGSAPTGLSTTNVTPLEDGFSAVVSITGWGGLGDSTTRRRSLNVRTYDASSLITPRIYTVEYGNALSSTITVTNDKHSGGDGALIVAPNTRYTLSAIANNGTYNTGHVRVGDYVTLPYKVCISPGSISSTSATFNYEVLADGGFYDNDIEYSVDGGTTWVAVETITGGAASSGTFTVSGLEPKEDYTIQVRAKTTSGSNVSVYKFSTKSIAFYGPVSDEATKIDKFYGSVGGETTLVNKLYGSVNEKTKLIYQNFGHLDYT